MKKEKVKTLSVEPQKPFSVDALVRVFEASGRALSAADVEYMEQKEKCMISTKKKYKNKEYMLSVKGVRTLTFGDIHMIQAQAKSGKTTLVTIIVAAILAGQWGVLKSLCKRKAKIFIFDTEQFEGDTNKMYETIKRNAGMRQENLNRLAVFSLRNMSYEERRHFVTESIEREKPTLVVIDGLRDLIRDINDGVGCTQFVEEMMQLASKANCAIIGILHNNPNDSKARGWLGTEWINKCGYSYEPQKSGNVVTVKNPVFRGAQTPDWQFAFADDGFPICDETAVNDAVVQYKQAIQKETEDERERNTQKTLSKVIEILQEKDNVLSRGELVKEIENRNIMKRTAAYAFISNQLTRTNPPFTEVSKKIVLTRNHEEAESTL